LYPICNNAVVKSHSFPLLYSRPTVSRKLQYENSKHYNNVEYTTGVRGGGAVKAIATPIDLLSNIAFDEL